MGAGLVVMSVEKKLDELSEKMDSMADRQEDIMKTQSCVIERLEKAEQVTDVIIRVSQSVSEKVVNLIGWVVVLGGALIVGWAMNFFKLKTIIEIIK
jgi:hypothetical protein